jgi:hypothetical protein
VTRIMITLRSDESEALGVLAEKERRDPRAQAALLIRRELERVGLLQPLSPIQTVEASPRPEGQTQG